MATEYFNDAWRIPNNKNQSLVSNYSMQFDGSNDNITLDNTGDFLNLPYLSISIWFKPIAISGFGDCILNNSYFDSGFMSYGIQCYPDRRIRFVSKVTSADFTTDLYNFNEWNHFVVTYDATNGLTFYLNNGSPINFPTPNTPLVYTGSTLISNNVTIGSAAAGGSVAAPQEPTQHFNGSIDQVSIFDYGLSASQVATLYGGGTAVTNPMVLNPVAYYQLGDQTASNDTTEPTPAVQSYLVPNNSLQDYVFDFNPNDADYINFINGSTMARGQEITYSVWANLDSFGNDIIGNKSSSNNGTGLNFAAGNLIFQLGDGSNNSWSNSRITLSSYVNTGEWFHIIGTFDGTNAKIYINGIERNNWTPTQPFTISGWNNNFQIGKRADQGSSFINGRLSNVAFWNSGLTPTQVTTLYNNGSPAADISSLSPISWWKLNAQDTFNGSNWTITDYAGSNDGTSNGMTSANLVQSDLQHTSGYSPYALSLSGGGEFMFTNISALTSISTITTSIWVKLATTNFGYALNINGNNSTEISFGYNSGKFFFYSGAVQGYAANPSSAGVWYNIVLTRSGDTMKMYINGVLEATATGLTTLSLNDYVLIGKRSNGFNIAADVSNLAIWSSELTTSQITTLYSQGLPSNLSTFSTKSIFWSQFGTNSSFNAAANRWTSIDEISGNSVLSHTVMSEDDIVNGPGYSGNGLGTSSIEIVGSAPYSTANGISNSMDVLSRSTDLPPTV